MDSTARVLLDGIFASPAMSQVFADRARVQSMLDFEAALARAEAASAVIPPGAAEVIAAHCHAGAIDFALLSRESAQAGNLAIPLVKALRARVSQKDAEAARFVHWGATSQDCIDTGLVLQLRSALALLDAGLTRLGVALANLAKAHEHTLLLGRTWLQGAAPMSFGMKVSGWLSAVERDRMRLSQLRERALVLQFGGAVGTLASLGSDALAVTTHLARGLNLGVPDLPWHTQRDRLAEAGTVLALLSGTLGKIARDVSLMSQAEVAEAFEPSAPGRGGSSTMPQKRNPVSAAVILAAATRVPPLAATLLSAMPQEHERGLGGWQAEWETLPDICLLTSGALEHAVRLAEGIEIDSARMRANLDALFGTAMAESVALTLARHMAREDAHELVTMACRRALQERRPLTEILIGDPKVTTRLSSDQIIRACDPESYLGLAETWVKRTLAAFESEQSRTGA